jgi:DnaJ-class molecular chaperone
MRELKPSQMNDLYARLGADRKMYSFDFNRRYERAVSRVSSEADEAVKARELKALNFALAVLSDPDRRFRYDRANQNAGKPEIISAFAWGWG